MYKSERCTGSDPEIAACRAAVSDSTCEKCPPS